MIKILCLVPNELEVSGVKKLIQDAIISCEELPYYQRWVRPGKQFGPMLTENCEIDFRLQDPDKTGGLSVDLVYGVFNCDYSDELIAELTYKRNLGIQKKYGKSELPIWEIVLKIEKDYAKSFYGRNLILKEKLKTCERCIHDEKSANIVGSSCYLCKRNPTDNRFDWFEEKKG